VGKLSAAEKKKVQLPLLWIGLGSIVMTFAGLTSGYVVHRSAKLADNSWLQFPLPMEFAYATAVIVLSSLVLVLAKSQIRRSNIALAGNLTLLALIMGLAFLYLQWQGAVALMDQGYFFTGGNSASSWVYVIAGLHWIHVISGILVLLYTWYRTAILKVHTAKEHQGFRASSIYWHFLDGLWLYLYFFLLFIR
jgi:cytochrome c oxidase subunit 3